MDKLFEEKIDVVITWVDGNDEKWRSERNTYSKGTQNEYRFRDWGTLKYIFRGIEKYMSWINSIYLVTFGHVPEWLDISNDKLHIVKHEDFIPCEYLPTFNSNTIDLNLHRIKGLSERFIYFNDDMFVVNLTHPWDLFTRDGVRDIGIISPQPIVRDDIRNIEINNLKILNSHFSISDIKKKYWKWVDFTKYNLYGIRSAIFMQFNTIIGIFQPHTPYSFYKSTFNEIWQAEYNELNNTCKNKFRSTSDVNIWLMRSWQLLKGDFLPRDIRWSKFINAENVEEVEKYVKRKKCKLLCVNDDGFVTDFENKRKYLINYLEKLFPEKCCYEK